MPISREEIVELCSRLIEIDSINPFRWKIDREGNLQIDGNEGELLNYCEEYLNQCGFETKRQDCGGGRENLLAQKGSGKYSLLLYGHADTVEVKPGWTKKEALTPTLGEREIGGKLEEVLYGLGANDMKGGLAAILCSARHCSIPRGCKLKIAIGCDEEFWSLGSYKLVNSEFIEDVELVLVPEVGESGSQLPEGTIPIGLGRCGRIEYYIHCPGTGGHGAEPDRPDRLNAISSAAKLTLMIEKFSKRFQPQYPLGTNGPALKPSLLVTEIRGGDGVLSIPSEARITVNRVLLPGESPQKAERELTNLIQQLTKEEPILKERPELTPKLQKKDRPTPPLLPYLIPTDDPIIQKVIQLCQKRGKVYPQIGVSVADENRFAAEAKKRTLTLGPKGENSHAPKEWVSIPSLLQTAQIYLDIIENFSKIIRDIR